MENDILPTGINPSLAFFPNTDTLVAEPFPATEGEYVSTGETCKTCGHKDYDHIGGHCRWRQHGAVLACECTIFVSPTAEAVAALPFKEKKILACANSLGVLPEQISKVEVRDTGGYFREVACTVVMYTGTTPDEWVEENIPKEKVIWITKYLEEKNSKKHR